MPPTSSPSIPQPCDPPPPFSSPIPLDQLHRSILYHPAEFLLRRSKKIASVSKDQVSDSTLSFFRVETAFSSFPSPLHPLLLQNHKHTVHYHVEQTRALLPSLIDGCVKGNSTHYRFLERNAILCSNLLPQDGLRQNRIDLQLFHGFAQIFRCYVVEGVLRIYGGHKHHQFIAPLVSSRRHETYRSSNFSRTPSLLKAESVNIFPTFCCPKQCVSSLFPLMSSGIRSTT